MKVVRKKWVVFATIFLTRGKGAKVGREGRLRWEGGMFGMEGMDAGDGREGCWGFGVEVW